MLNFRARVNSSPRASRRKARGALPPAPAPARAPPRAAADLPQVPAPQTVPSGVQVMPLPLDASCFALRATANLPVPRPHLHASYSHTSAVPTRLCMSALCRSQPPARHQRSSTYPRREPCLPSSVPEFSAHGTSDLDSPLTPILLR